MIEVVSEAVVLDKEFTYDAHVRVHLFTKECGKMVARATSARKITSKLGPHLEPLTVSIVKFVQQRGLPQLTDALRTGLLPHKAMPLVRMVSALAPEGEPDLELWELLTGLDGTVRRALSVLGYNPEFASCEWCDGRPDNFSLRTLFFVCDGCLPRAGASYDCMAI